MGQDSLETGGMFPRSVPTMVSGTGQFVSLCIASDRPQDLVGQLNSRSGGAGKVHLMLDEVTSALDPATEQDICTNIAGLAGEITIVAIAHREIWTVIADRICEVKAGRVTLKNDGNAHRIPA